MPSYADTRDMLLMTYPTLYIDETDVLHSLFFLAGTGFKWEDGELVSWVPSFEEEAGIAKRSQRVHVERMIQCEEILEKIAPGTSMLGYWQDRLADILTGDQETYAAKERERERDNRYEVIDSDRGNDCWFLLNDGETIGRVMSPRINEWVNILRIPEDVKPDWLEAAQRALEWAQSPACRTTAEDQKWLRKAAELLRSRA